MARLEVLSENYKITNQFRNAHPLRKFQSVDPFWRHCDHGRMFLLLFLLSFEQDISVLLLEDCLALVLANYTDRFYVKQSFARFVPVCI